MFLKRAIVVVGFPGGSVVKNLPVDAGDAGSIAWSGRCPGGGHGNSIQYSCMENSKDRGGWQATIHGVAESRKPLGDLTTTINYSHHAVHYIPAAAAAATSLQLCPTLCNPIDSSPPGSPVPGILQARTLGLLYFVSESCECLCYLVIYTHFIHPPTPSCGNRQSAT